MFQGSMVAMVTPMDANGSLDFASMERLIDFHVESGTNAIISVGTSGESATLGFEEHYEVVRRTVEYADGRIPVIAGTGANSTSEAIELTAGAKRAGADACLLVTPYYNKPTQEGLYRHFKAVAEAVAIDQILYNVPGRTACDMLNETVLRLVEIPNIVGLKDATGDLQRGASLITSCGDDFAVYSGDDATALDLILLGGKGDISVTANVAPEKMAQMCGAALLGDADKAKQINQFLMGLHENLFVESNPIPVKWAVKELGLINEGIRLPLTWLSASQHDVVRQAMRQAGVI